MRRVKFWSVILVMIFSSNIIKSQEYYLTNQYVYDLFWVNPAAAAYQSECTSVTSTFQKQWFGTDRSPSTQSLSLQTDLHRGLGLGSYVYNDQNGAYRRMGLQQAFSYEVLLSKQRRGLIYLRFGLAMSVQQSSLDLSGFTSGALSDNAITDGASNGWGLNANSGLMLKIYDAHIGLSVTNLFGQNNPMFNGDIEPNIAPDINIHIGIPIQIPDRNLIIEPLVYYRRNSNADRRLDLNLKYTIPTLNPNFGFWGLVAYRRSMDEKFGTDLGIATTFGVTVGRINAGIEYQMGLTSAQPNFGSFYKFVLGYKFCRDSSKNPLPCPKNKRGRGGKEIDPLMLPPK